LQTPLQQALAAAREFKYMLDIQQPGTLRYPGRKKIDPRDSACYKKAAADLAYLSLQEHDSSQSPTAVLEHLVPTSWPVADDGANAVACPVNVFSDVVITLANLGIKKISYDSDGGENGGFVVLGFCSLSSLEKIAQLAHSENNLGHKSSYSIVEPHSATVRKNSQDFGAPDSMPTRKDLITYWNWRGLDWEIHRWFYRDKGGNELLPYLVWSNVLDSQGFPGCYAVCDDFGNLVPVLN